jgi:hypothetical protein
MNFLEPVYINEKMVLNCAGYLWKGVATETEVKELSKTALKGGAKAGIPLLQQLLNVFSIEGSATQSGSEEHKSARRYTVGALHMSVLDSLRNEHMLTEVFVPLN